MEQKRRIVPPVYFFGSLLAMAALHHWLPIARLIAPPWSYGGTILLVLGIAMSATAAGTFRRAGTPVIPFERSTVIVTGGLFRFTRNPMYLGMVVGLVGAAILSGTLGAFIPILFFIWVIQARFIRGEERFLEELFGEQYLAYKRRVRRWL